jgi:phosphatidylglycerol:prolipoprotein diacylglycerol transferase
MILDLFRNLFAPPRDLILLVAAAWIGMSLAEKRAARSHTDKSLLNNLIFYGILAYLLGGRIFYALEHLSAFAQSPLSLISLNTSAFDNWGALAAALIAGFVYGQRKGMLFWPALDALTPFFALLAIGIGFSHLASGAAFGRETAAPWGIYLWGATRQPTQIYEIIASLLTFGVIWFKKADSKPGADFLLFAALTSASRLVIEGFRGDSTLILGGIRSAQVIAWLILAVSLVALELLKPRPAPMTVASEQVVAAVEAGPQKGAKRKASTTVKKTTPSTTKSATLKRKSSKG